MGAYVVGLVRGGGRPRLAHHGDADHTRVLHRLLDLAGHVAREPHCLDVIDALRLHDDAHLAPAALKPARRAPTKSAYAYYDETEAKLKTVLAELDAVLGKDLAEFNRLVREKEIPPVIVPPEKAPPATERKK